MHSVAEPRKNILKPPGSFSRFLREL